MTIDAPPFLLWKELKESFTKKLDQSNIRSNQDSLLQHYAYLLQVTSWGHGINWEPEVGHISLSLETVSAKEWDLTKDQLHEVLGVQVDAITLELLTILTEVPLKRVQSHFLGSSPDIM